MPSDPHPVPVEIVQLVEAYVSKQVSDAEKYENSELLDESGIWSLHRLAAEVYMLGFRDGEFVESERARHAASRERDRVKKAGA